MLPASALLPYRSPQSRDAKTRELAEKAGGEVLILGHSVEGREILAVRLPSTRGENAAPPILCAANIHGVEFVAAEVALAFLESFANQHAQAQSLRDQAEVWVIPSLNPDAYARTWESAGTGTVSQLRKNAGGVDLNRNFPLPPGRKRRPIPGTGSPKKNAVTYRGPNPLSEPETRALFDLVNEVPFVASANLHSFMGTLITPRVPNRLEYRAYDRLCRAFGRAQKFHRYRRMASRMLDVFTGEQEDHQHHVHGTWATCVEVFPVRRSYGQHFKAPTTFWRFNPREPSFWIDNDLPGLFAYFEAALRLPRPHERADLKRVIKTLR